MIPKLSPEGSRSARSRFLPLLALSVWTILQPLPLSAAIKSWLAPAFGGDRRWSVGANWGGTPPVNGDSLIFSQKSDTVFQADCTNNLSSLQLGSILFDGPANAVPDLYGNSVTLSAGISEGVSFWGAKVGLPITLAADQTFESVLDGHLDLTNVNVNARALTLETRLLSSQISILGRLSGSGRVDIVGLGSVSFASPLTNTFSGPIRLLQGGRLDLRSRNAAGGIPSVLGDLQVGDGIEPSHLSVYADHQIEGDLLLKPGSDLFMNALDILPSLTLIDATVLVALDQSLSLGGPVTVGGASNSTIRGSVALGTASRNFTVSNNVELRLQGAISGVNLSLMRPGIIKSGEGTLLLLSNSTFGGHVSINAGRVIAAEPLSLGAATSEILGIVNGATAVAQGGELLLSAVHITNELLTLATTTGGLSSTGTCVWAGNISLTTNAPFNVSNSTLTVEGVLFGAGGLVKRGAGSLLLSGPSANSFSAEARHEQGLLLLNKPAGVAAISGDLQVGDGAGGANADIVRVQAAEQIADTSRVTLTSSGQLDLNAAETVGSISGPGMVRVDGGDLTFGGNGTDETLAATVAGVFGLTKIGAGTQTLAGVNTYTGTTRVLAGTLRVNGSQPQSPVNVIGATLEGNGVVGHVTSNGRISPGAGSIGTLTCSNLTFQAGGSLAVQIGGASPGSGHDQLIARGAVQLAGAALLPTLQPGYLPPSGATFVLLANDGNEAIGGTFSGLPNGASVTVGPGLRFQVRYNGGDGNDVSLTFTNETLAANSLVVSGGNGNGRVDPNECALISGLITNQSPQSLSNVLVEFRPLSAGVTISQPLFSFPLVPAGQAVPLPPTAVLSLASNVPCGSFAQFAVILSQRGVFISSTIARFLVGSGGPAGCADGGGACAYCPDVTLHGSLVQGDLEQAGTLKADDKPTDCGTEAACPGVSSTTPHRVDAMLFQNGPQAACLTVELENLCSDPNSELFAAAYSGSFNPSNLCSRFLAEIGTPVVGGKNGKFSFKADAGASFIITVNEYTAGLSCADYRLAVTGGDCRPRLRIEEVPGPRVHVSWPNSAAEWRPQDAPAPGSWSDLNIATTNAEGRVHFETSGGQTSRLFRLRKP